MTPGLHTIRLGRIAGPAQTYSNLQLTKHSVDSLWERIGHVLACQQHNTGVVLLTCISFTPPLVVDEQTRYRSLLPLIPPQALIGVLTRPVDDTGIPGFGRVYSRNG